jgi:hypothetical protein
MGLVVDFRLGLTAVMEKLGVISFSLCSGPEAHAEGSAHGDGAQVLRD